MRDGDELVGLGRTLLAAGASGLVTAIRPVPDLATALLMGWFYDGLDPAGQLGLAQVGTVLGQAQRQLRGASAADLVERGVHLVAAGGDQAVLGCRTIAVAHRTAGEMEAFVTWQRHLSRLVEGQPLPAGATSRHVSTSARRTGRSVRSPDLPTGSRSPCTARAGRNVGFTSTADGPARATMIGGSVATAYGLRASSPTKVW